MAEIDPEALRQHIQVQLDRIASENTVRFGLLQEELDRRFTGIQMQMDQRFEAASTAVHAALRSAENAVNKAEFASEARFASVNEFRSQQADLIKQFLNRTEYVVAHQGLVDKIDSLAGITQAETVRVTERFAALELRLTTRLDVGQGRAQGVREYRDDQRLNVNVVLQVLGLLVAAGILYATFHH